MPANQEARPLPSPWKEFLALMDGILHEPLELHCIGGFVFTYFYGLPRTTGDIDYYTAIPAKRLPVWSKGVTQHPAALLNSYTDSRGKGWNPCFPTPALNLDYPQTPTQMTQSLACFA